MYDYLRFSNAKTMGCYTVRFVLYCTYNQTSAVRENIAIFLAMFDLFLSLLCLSVYVCHVCLYVSVCGIVALERMN